MFFSSSSQVDLGYLFLGGRPQRGSAVCIMSYRERILSAWLNVPVLTLAIGLRQRLSFSPLWSFPFLFLSALSSLEWSHCAQPALKKEGELLSVLKAEHACWLWGHLMHGRLSTLPFYLIIVYISVDLWIFILCFGLESNRTSFIFLLKLLCDAVFVLHFAPGSSYMFPVPIWESAVPPRSPGSLIGKWN